MIQKIRSLRRHFLFSVGLGLAIPFFLHGLAFAQTSFTDVNATGAWNTARWNNATDAAPYTSNFAANNAVNFTSGAYTFAGMGATTNVGDVTVASGVTVNFATIGSTYATGGSVRTIDVGANGLFDLNGNSVSTAAGTGLIKTGAGVFGTGAGTFSGGFTLNAGTVIARGTTGLGSGGSNILTLNGGTVASNANRSFDNTRFGGGIVIGGNVQFGELVTNASQASSSANLAFANNISLGNVARTITQGNNGTNTFSGVISNTSGGLTFAANAGTDGRFEFTNTANTFTGDININGGEVRFTTDGSMGNAANNIVIDGGRFGKASDATTVTLGANRSISVGDGTGTSISSAGSGTLIYNGAIANKSGETGSWAKQGGGVLELGGVSNYTGSTAINNGTVRLTTGNDRLPTGTVVSLGQAASANLGTLDLNGFNQTIAGLNSVAGTNASTNKNVVTSVAPATLSISGSGSYGDATNSNSGVISGAISVVKNGAGTQTFGDANTYTGTTTVNAGTLAIAVGGTHTGGGSYSVSSGGTLTVNGTIGSAVNVSAGGTLSGTGTLGALTISGSLAPGNSIGTINTGTVVWNGALDNTQAWKFELGTGETSDRLNINGDFARGTGSVFAFDFLGSTQVGSFTLAQWSGNSTGFTVNDFTYSNLGGGISGAFELNSSSLRFTAVPEPSSIALLSMVGLAGVVTRRSRKGRAG